MTPWPTDRQSSLSMGFSRQEYWSGLPFPPPGDLPDPGIEPGSPALGVKRTFNTMSTYLGASILVVIFIFFFYQKDIDQSLEEIGVSEMIF